MSRWILWVATAPTLIASACGGDHHPTMASFGDAGIGSTTAMTSSATGPRCDVGTIVCLDAVAYECDAMGNLVDPKNCAPKICEEGLGCVDCQPSSFRCNGDDIQSCNQDGNGWTEVESCDPLQGLTCNADSGTCEGACAYVLSSYLGCDFYPTVTANVVNESFNFAVAVSNTANDAADITVTKGNAIVAQTSVAGNSVEIIPLPWVENLMQRIGGVAMTPPKASLLEPEGAYRLRTTRPVTVYQYNPLEYAQGNTYSYTNDASLLLPVNTWGLEYFVAARNTMDTWVGFYAVVAAQDGTTVWVDPSPTGSSTIIAGGGIGDDGQGTVVLQQGDVLEVFSGEDWSDHTQSPEEASLIDVTGTRITSDKPVQVISGHQCTWIPHNVSACDHLEESMLPFDALALEYIVTTPLVSPLGGTPFPKARFVRIIATTPNTTLSYDPPIPGAPDSIAIPGEYVEIGPTSADFAVSSNFKILVAEYMQGQNAGGDTGDPAMALAVPTQQYRSDYLVHAPTNYETSWVNITAPTGATIMLDGSLVMNFAPIGNTNYEIARVALSNFGDGTHELTGDQRFGVTVYGYGQYTSYWYPGGMDLEFIPPQ